MLSTLATMVVGWGVPSKFAKPLIFGALALLILAVTLGLKCSYDRNVIERHEAKERLEQVKRERTADKNLHIQTGRDQAASQQRREEIDNATLNVPDQAPSARQRARACPELQRQAKAHRRPAPAC